MLIIAISCLLGLSVAGYLSYHSNPSALACGDSASCAAVLSSDFATFLSIPVSVFGLSLFLALTFVIFRYYESGISLRQTLSQILVLIIPAATIALYFITVQLFVLKQICWMCMTFHAAIIAILLISIKLLRSDSNDDENSHNLLNLNAFPYLTVLLSLMIPSLLYISYSNFSSNGPSFIQSNSVVVKGKGINP